MQSEAAKTKMRAYWLAHYAVQENREKTSLACVEGWKRNHDKRAATLSAALKGKKRDPSLVARITESLLTTFSRPDVKERQREAARRTWSDPAKAKAIRDGHRRVIFEPEMVRMLMGMLERRPVPKWQTIADAIGVHTCTLRKYCIASGIAKPHTVRIKICTTKTKTGEKTKQSGAPRPRSVDAIYRELGLDNAGSRQEARPNGKIRLAVTKSRF